MKKKFAIKTNVFQIFKVTHDSIKCFTGCQFLTENVNVSHISIVIFILKTFY
jgi:hypothetical protein